MNRKKPIFQCKDHAKELLPKYGLIMNALERDVIAYVGP